MMISSTIIMFSRSKLETDSNIRDGELVAKVYWPLIHTLSKLESEDRIVARRNHVELQWACKFKPGRTSELQHASNSAASILQRSE